MSGTYQPEGGLPGADERQQIMMKAGLVLQEARRLQATLNTIENRLSWKVDREGGEPDLLLAGMIPPGPPTALVPVAA